MPKMVLSKKSFNNFLNDSKKFLEVYKHAKQYCMVIGNTQECTGMITNSGKCLHVGRGSLHRSFNCVTLLKLGGDGMAVHYITLFTFLYGNEIFLRSQSVTYCVYYWENYSAMGLSSCYTHGLAGCQKCTTLTTLPPEPTPQD